MKIRDEKGVIKIYNYSIAQWILFFFLYCFIGWIWESVYVSIVNAVKTRKIRWINRGFLNGPLLPIYGCAAIVILLAAIPVKGDNWKVFLFGMAAATLMELVTGSIMEKLFRVKYWDYSEFPLNYKGYICLFPSLLWGACSLVLVELLHPPIEQVVMRFPDAIVEISAFVFVAIFFCDFTISFNEAMDMRELLEKLSEHKEVLYRLERRFDAIVAFTPIPDKDDFSRMRKNAKDRFLSNVEKLRQNRLGYLNRIKERIQLPDMEELPDKDMIQEMLEQQFRGIFSRTNKQFLKARRHLRRNPGAISKKYEEALREIRDLLDKDE